MDFLETHRTVLSTVVYGRVFIKRGGKIPLCRGGEENTLTSGIAYTKQSKIIQATFPAAPSLLTAGKILQEGSESSEKVQQVTEAAVPATVLASFLISYVFAKGTWSGGSTLMLTCPSSC